MGKIIFSIFIALLAQLSVALAEQYSDSLKVELSWYRKNCPTCDSSIVELLNSLAWEFRYKDRDSSVSWANSALSLSQKSGYLAGEASALTRIGVLYKISGDYESALISYQKALEIRKRIDRPIEVAGAYNNIGIVLRRQGKFHAAIDSTKKALLIAENLNDSIQVAKFSNSLGGLFRQIGNYKDALKAYHRTIKIRIAVQDSNGLIRSYNNIGSFYYTLGFDKMARTYYDKCLEIQKIHGSNSSLSLLHYNLGNVALRLRDFKEAIRHYNTCLELDNQMKDSSQTADILYNKGLVFLETKDPNQAIEFLDKSYLLFEKRGNRIKKYNALHSKGAAQILLGDLREAEQSIQVALKFAEESSEARLESFCLEDLATIAMKLNDPEKALNYTRRWHKIRDSLNRSKEEVIDIAFFEKELEQEQIKKEAEAQKAIVQKEKAGKQKRNWIILALTLGTVLLLIGGGFFVRWLRQRQKVELTESTEQATATGLVAGQEAERKRIAVDLHDRLGSLLSLIKLQFSSQEAKSGQTEAQQREYERARALIDQAVKEVGQIVWEMEARDLQELGLLPALKNLFQVYRELGLKIDLYHFDLYQRLGFEVEKNLFRIIQEVMNNTIKHAKANQVTTQLLVSEGNLNVVIEDDGVGFDPQNAQVNGRFSGNGLKNIQLRVESLNGTLQLDSTPGRGTTIVIDLPVQPV